MTGVVLPYFTVLYTEALYTMKPTEVVAHRMFWPIIFTIALSLFLAFSIRAIGAAILSKIED